ncbi:MAG: flagellar assembly protein FliW [Solirubrobacteraceae bacterium]|nr:flagellar assembly protein FliW [Solirubrobacteraceae bacterium]
MTASLTSTRFGDIEIADDAIIEFQDGLVGLPGSRYALLPPDPTAPDGGRGPFRWLQSMDDPAIALPVTQPQRFFPDYVVDVDEGEIPSGLRDLADPSAASAWVTVRAAARLEDFVVNLRAPLIVAGGRGWQVINRAEDAALRAPLPLGSATSDAPSGDAAA